MRTLGNLAGVSFIDAPIHLQHEAREQWREIITESSYFFTKDTMRFFGSRVVWDSLTALDRKTYGFITSEQCDGPRAYTVRLWTLEFGVNTASKFQEFETLAVARGYLRTAGFQRELEEFKRSHANFMTRNN